MDEDIDFRLADKLEFRVDHLRQRISSDDPDIYVHDRGCSPEPYLHYFTLHWNGRAIPVRTEKRKENVGKNDKGQWIWEVDWTILSIGYPDHASREPAPPYQFKSQQEYMCAAHLILKALGAYGGILNAPKFNLFPEYRRITAELSVRLKADMYGDLN